MKKTGFFAALIYLEIVNSVFLILRASLNIVRILSRGALR